MPRLRGSGCGRILLGSRFLSASPRTVAGHKAGLAGSVEAVSVVSFLYGQRRGGEKGRLGTRGRQNSRHRALRRARCGGNVVPVKVSAKRKQPQVGPVPGQLSETPTPSLLWGRKGSRAQSSREQGRINPFPLQSALGDTVAATTTLDRAGHPNTDGKAKQKHGQRSERPSHGRC